MGTVLQFAAFVSICCLISSVLTQPNQEDKRLNNKHSNKNGKNVGDFYFDEQKTNENNVKTGRAIPQTAWSKENKEQIQPDGDKSGAQSSEEFSLKNALSYLLNMIHELKNDIFGIKEMTALKGTKDLTNFEDNVKQKEMGENNDTPQSDSTTENAELEKKNQKPKSNYITDYYQKNGIKFVDDELEASSDESDDSSHNYNEEAGLYEISKNEENTCTFECSEIKRNRDSSSEGGETTSIPMSATKMPEQSDLEFGDTKDSEKDGVFKKPTTKPSKMEIMNSKTSTEENENTPMSKKGKCVRIKNDDSDNLSEFTEKPLKSDEMLTTRGPQNEKFNEAKPQLPNQNKNTGYPSKMSSMSPDSRRSEKNSQNIGGSDFASKSGALEQSTTLPSQSSQDNIYPDIIENKPSASGMSSGKPINKNQQEQINSLKPEKEDQDNAKSQKNNERENEYTTDSLQSQDSGTKIPNNEMGTDNEIKDNPKESKDKQLNYPSSHTTVAYRENNSKSEGQQTSNSFVTGNTILPTTSENILNAGNTNKDSSENLDGKEVTKNEESNATQQGKNDSETQRDTETEQTETQQLGGSELENSLKNKNLNELNQENNNNQKDNNLSSITTNDHPSPPDSNSENQNPDVEEPDKPQEKAQKDEENLNKKLEISPDQEYEYEDDMEDFDISDEYTDMETDEDFDPYQEEELVTNNRKEENDDEMNPGNTATGSTNESQISQHAGYKTEEKPKEQYDTFLEYFYKHSDSSLFQSLKNQSNNFSQ